MVKNGTALDKKERGKFSFYDMGLSELGEVSSALKFIAR